MNLAYRGDEKTGMKQIPPFARLCHRIGLIVRISIRMMDGWEGLLYGKCDL